MGTCAVGARISGGSAPRVGHTIETTDPGLRFKIPFIDKVQKSERGRVARGRGDRTVTEVVAIGRQDIEVTAQIRLQELCDQYESGIRIEQVVLQDVNPPDPVKPSWDEVNQAQQQRDRLINEA